jgi:hypothetical protein
MSTTRSAAITAVLIVVLIAPGALVFASGTPQSQAPGLDAFAWLEGEWERTTSRGLSVERWTRLADGSLTGESVTLPTEGGDEVHGEALQLAAMGDAIFYIARPRQNEYPTGFKLVELTAQRAVFDNPNHDFPQRITYSRTGDDAFTVTITGPGDDGASQEIDFHFVRRQQD